ncbi:uncharacterized protein F4817DRAFT_360751 [Daldinia loculata]|uniref:uncharacterized protein n=1 Tax=Daldinia loculata TaxID=103429 RepID=UPI0020C386EB|nr:uncharacterized protein F4817DRAFT_360751 [Daldinia loculata]KAI1644448.1 hypothetical protein F4817DRAFT_360751 [Daldinia loculata]
MDPSSGPRGRGRKSSTFPSTFPVTSSPHNSSEQPMQQPSSAASSFSFTAETPSPSASREKRIRARNIDSAGTMPEDSASKGGRSLRKRPRVDYTFDQLDDIESYGAKSTPSATRTLKRRKTDFVPNENETNEDSEARTSRRASEQPQPSSSRKRNTRKSTAEPQTYVPEQQMDDVEVRDTIEVGGHHSGESDESMLRRTSSGSGSSNNETKAPIPNISVDMSISSESSQSSKPSETSEPSVPSEPSQPSQLSLYTASGESHPNLQKAQPETMARNEDELREQEDEADDDDILDTDDDHAEPDLLDHLTPYINGSFVYYPDYQDDELELPEAEAEPEVDAEADPNADAEANPGTAVNAEADPEAGLELEPDAANEDGPEVVAVEEDAAVGDTPADTAANSPATELEPSGTQPADMKQFRFKQARRASEFTDLFKDIKSLSPKELYQRVEVANKALAAWQDEFKELRKWTDDYDNSIRAHKEDEAFNRRFKATVARDPNANPIQKDFIVKGVRAKDTTEPEVAYARQQDRIMANVYGFEYDPRADKVGKQDPIAQRTGLGRHGRLRERPKQTAKAAEAEDPNIMQGKRTRKPPERFNEGEAASRGSTPAPAQRRGRRGAQAQENGDQQQNQNQPQAQVQNTSALNVASEPVEKEPPKKKGKGGRPRKNPLPVPEAQPTPDPEPEHEEPNPEPQLVSNSHPKAQLRTPSKSQAKPGPKAKPIAELTPQLNMESKPDSAPSLKRGVEEAAVEEEQPRKRKRKAPANATAVIEQEEEDNVPNGAEPLTPSKPARRTNSRKSDIPSGSFKTATPKTVTSTSHQPEEPRPPTASSTATAETVASTSNYQLREKRQRKFTNDINDDDFIEEPKPKRAKRAPKKTQTKVEDLTPAPEPAPVQQLEQKAPPAPKPPTKIKFKVKNQHPASVPALSTPPLVPSNLAPIHTNNTINGNSNGDNGSNGFAEPNTPDGEIGADPNKDYNSMTKSEKMSYSMKARWASGSMNTAVAKRRATLAAKKQSAKPPAGANSTALNQAGTPTSRSTPGGDEDDDATAPRQ